MESATSAGSSSAENGKIISDSAEVYRHKGYAITMAEKLNSNAELVIEDSGD
jgi:hypothetical protein